MRSIQCAVINLCHSPQSVLPSKYYLSDQIENNEMGGAGSTYEEKRGASRIWLEDLWEEDHLDQMDL